MYLLEKMIYVFAFVAAQLTSTPRPTYLVTIYPDPICRLSKSKNIRYFVKL